MKTILNILIILIVASLIAAGFWLVVNNTSSVSRSADKQPPAMTSADGTLPARPEGGPNHEGGEHGASLGRGLAGVFTTLAKLAVITGLILLVEKSLGLFGKKPVGSPA